MLLECGLVYTCLQQVCVGGYVGLCVSVGVCLCASAHVCVCLCVYEIVLVCNVKHFNFNHEAAKKLKKL